MKIIEVRKIPDELFMASLPIEVPANLANLASLCIGDFLESIVESIVAALSLFPEPLLASAMSIVISHAATDNEHFLPRSVAEPIRNYREFENIVFYLFIGC